MHFNNCGYLCGTNINEIIDKAMYKVQENSVRNQIRTLGVGEVIDFPVSRRHYVRAQITDARIDFPERQWRTTINRSDSTVIVNRIK